MYRRCSSLQLADSVLATLIAKHSDDETDFLIECYQNGREQGYSVSKSHCLQGYTVFFAMCRGSDQIAVYCSTCGNFTGISEEAYKTGRYFNPDQLLEAVEYIYQKSTEAVSR